MGQFSNVLLDTDNVQTVLQRTLDCRPGLGGLNQVMDSIAPLPLFRQYCSKYINIFTRCTNRNQYDILMTAVADVRKGQACHTKVSFKHSLDNIQAVTKFRY